MAVATEPRSAHEAQLGPPDPNGAPEHQNIYSHVRNTYAQLVPLFDDIHLGVIASGGAFLHGGVPWGRFFHKNTMDEVSVCFGARGGVLEMGEMMVGGRVHGVDSHLQDSSDPTSYMVMAITLRVPDSGELAGLVESLTFRCTECNHKLFEYEYNSVTGPTDPEHQATWPGRDDDPFLCFATQWGSWAAADDFNADESNRTCEKCGHVNEPFPVDTWGWKSYIDRHAAVASSYREITDRSLTGGPR